MSRLEHPETPANGKKQKTPVGCPHTDVCVSVKYHAEMMKSFDDYSLKVDKLIESVGLLLEQQDIQSTTLLKYANRVSEVAERQTRADQREEAYLNAMSTLTRDSSKAAVAAVRDELSMLVRAEVRRLKET
jgi:hypothetical protein